MQREEPWLSHHPPPLDIRRQVHVLSGPDRGNLAVEVAVKPVGGASIAHAAAAGAALASKPLLSEALQASIAGHQLHPVGPPQGPRVQVGQGGHAVMGVGKKQGHDEHKQEGHREEPHPQGALHGATHQEAGPPARQAAGCHCGHSFPSPLVGQPQCGLPVLTLDAKGIRVCAVEGSAAGVPDHALCRL